MRTIEEAREYQRKKMSQPGAMEALNQRIARALEKDGHLAEAQWTGEPPTLDVPEDVPANDHVPVQMSPCEECGKDIDYEGRFCHACKKRRQRDGS